MFRLDHANINVGDLGRSVKFYGEAFGLKEIRRKTAEASPFCRMGKRDSVSS